MRPAITFFNIQLSNSREEAAIDSEEMNEIKDEWFFYRLENQVNDCILLINEVQ